MGYSREWETETKVGVMTRTMTRDVKDSVIRKIEQLYSDENGEFKEEYRKGCAEWHWNIVAYFKDPKKISAFTTIIELLYTRKIDPRKDEKFKRLMRKNFPVQFIEKVNNIGTQVPVLAVMDDTLEQKEVIHPWE